MNGEAIGVRLAAQALDIADLDDVFAIGRRGEMDHRVAAVARAAVVIAIEEVRHGQAVGRELRARWMNLDLVDG